MTGVESSNTDNTIKTAKKTRANLEVVEMKKPYKFLIAALVAIVIGSAIGYFTVKPAINLVTSWSNIKNGPWSTNFAIGSTGANPYVRAWVAKNGLMALNRSETIYLGCLL